MAKKETDNSRSRKWQLTINNPAQYGMMHERITDILSGYKSLVYWCMCDETGENGTYHTHVFLCFNDAVRFTTLKNLFPSAHFEMAKGTCQQNRDYVSKSGKWEESKKAETNHPETFEEYGSMPIERQGARNDLADLYDMVKQGLTNYEILEVSPNYIMNIEKIDRARQTVTEEKYKNEFRQLEVTYLYGKTGSGKTRGIMEQYGYGNVHRVTDYKNPFDTYKGQEVIVFEEFRSDLKIGQMLNYLDGYPLELPCRYNNKVACYLKVYLVTNIALEEQYREVQRNYEETWQAFLRRIHKVVHYTDNGIVDYTVAEYLDRKTSWQEMKEEKIPFNN